MKRETVKKYVEEVRSKAIADNKDYRMIFKFDSEEVTEIQLYDDDKFVKNLYSNKSKAAPHSCLEEFNIIIGDDTRNQYECDFVYLCLQYILDEEYIDNCVAMASDFDTPINIPQFIMDSIAYDIDEIIFNKK